MVENLEQSLADFRTTQSRRLYRAMQEYIRSNSNLSNRKLNDALDKHLAALVKDAFEEWRPEKNSEIGEIFEKIVTRFTLKANQIIEHIGKISKNVFDIEVETFGDIEKLTEESDFYYMLEDDDTMFMIDPSKLSFLLPKFLFRALIVRDLGKRVWDQLDRNCGRIRYDFVQRIDKSLRAFTSELNEKIHGLLDGVTKATKRALEKKQLSDYEVKENIEKLNEIESKLGKVLSDLNELKVQLESV